MADELCNEPYPFPGWKGEQLCEKEAGHDLRGDPVHRNNGDAWQPWLDDDEEEAD